MTARWSSPAIAPPEAVTEVVVTSAQLQVAQAVCAGLEQRGFAAECAVWTVGRPDGLDGAGHQVLLVLDDLHSRAAIDAVTSTVARWPGRSLLLTAQSPGAAWGAVFAAGIGDVASSDASLDDLQGTLAKVSAGESCTDPRRRRAMEQEWAAWLHEEEDLQLRVNRLSPREASVLARLAEGRRVGDIGAELGVSEGTVRSQVKSLRRKLGAESQLGAVAMARRVTRRLPEGGPVVPVPRSSRE